MAIRDIEAQAILKAKIDQHGFAKVAAEIDANRGHIWRSHNDAVHSPTLRTALGLAPLYELVADVCPECGHVHERLKTCDDERQKGYRPRFRRAGEFDRFRATIWDFLLKAQGTTTTEILNTILDDWLKDHEDMIWEVLDELVPDWRDDESD